VIDWMLNSDFPQSPPVAHFHSWTNGNGRGTIFVLSVSNDAH
jgi:ubiquitin-conjugating enzyme E2 O